MMKIIMVERQPPPHFHAATPAKHPRNGPSIVNSSRLMTQVGVGDFPPEGPNRACRNEERLFPNSQISAVPVRYISRTALSNFQPAERNLFLQAGCGNNDATVSSFAAFIHNLID